MHNGRKSAGNTFVCKVVSEKQMLDVARLPWGLIAAFIPVAEYRFYCYFIWGFTGERTGRKRGGFPSPTPHPLRNGRGFILQMPHCSSHEMSVGQQNLIQKNRFCGLDIVALRGCMGNVSTFRANPLYGLCSRWVLFEQHQFSVSRALLL